MRKFTSLESLATLANDFPKAENEIDVTEVDPAKKDIPEFENNNQVKLVAEDIKSKIEKEPEIMKEPEDIYFLGGKDVEMKVIEKRLKRSNKKYFNKELAWGAKIQDYSEQISEVLRNGDNPIAIELAGAETIAGVVDIDHHNDKFGRPASLLQVMDRLGAKTSLFDELIAANDSGFIPAMEKVIERYRYGIEESAGREIFEQLKEKWIKVIRKMDRKEQGIKPEQEKQAEEAVEKREDLFNNYLTIVRLPHSKTAAVTDRLYGSYKNLLVISSDGESNFYGNGQICQELKNKYEESWAGGSGLGMVSGEAYWGGYPDQNELEDQVKEKVKKLSENFSRFDYLFTPEDISQFTALGKKIYELGSYARMVEAVKVDDLTITNGGRNYEVSLKRNDGWKMYDLNYYDMVGGQRAFRDRAAAGKSLFGFSDEKPHMSPSFVYLREGEEISDTILRGLKPVEKIIVDKRSPSFNVINEFPAVQEALREEFKKADPRLLHYPLGEVDKTVQEKWEIKKGGGYFDEHDSAELTDACQDFILLGLRVSSTEKMLAKLQLEPIVILTPEIDGGSEYIKERYEGLEKTLNLFISPINREIQEKRIEYLKKAYDFVQKKENELKQLKEDPKYLAEYFAAASLENPRQFGLLPEDFEKLNLFFKNKLVAFYDCDSLSRTGIYKEFKLDSYNQFYPLNAYRSIETINSSVSFPADDFAVKEIIEALNRVGYRVEKIGNSGFNARNNYVVNLPKKAIYAHILKYSQPSGNKKIGYYGEVPVEINDPDEKELVERIIKEIEQRKVKDNEQEFIDEFKKRGDGITGIMTIGGTNKFQSIPSQFVELARKRVGNTADHRQNRTHTDDVFLLDREKIAGKKNISINVPSDYKGFVIGKGGENIKRISNDLGIYIKINN